MPDETIGAIMYFLVIPLNFVLVVLALLDVTRRPAWQMTLLTRAIWGLAILMVWVVGPAAYLVWKRRFPAANAARGPKSPRSRRGAGRKRR